MIVGIKHPPVTRDPSARRHYHRGQTVIGGGFPRTTGTKSSADAATMGCGQEAK
jgi:hypothetical protein